MKTTTQTLKKFLVGCTAALSLGLATAFGAEVAAADTTDVPGPVPSAPAATATVSLEKLGVTSPEINQLTVPAPAQAQILVNNLDEAHLILQQIPPQAIFDHLRTTLPANGFMIEWQIGENLQFSGRGWIGSLVGSVLDFDQDEKGPESTPATETPTPEAPAPAPTPGTPAPEVPAPTDLPQAGVTLTELGLQVDPALSEVTLPAGTQLRTSWSSADSVSVIVDTEDEEGLSAHVTRNLRQLGFTIDWQVGTIVNFSGNGWSGNLTGSILNFYR